MNQVFGNENFREYKTPRGYKYYIGKDGQILDYKFQDAKDQLKLNLDGYQLLHGKLLHRLMYKLFIGDIPEKKEIDHIDKNKQNNALNNLRLLSHQDNCFNRTNNNIIQELPQDAIQISHLRSHNNLNYLGQNWYYSKSQNVMYKQLEQRAYSIIRPLQNNNKKPSQYFKVSIQVGDRIKQKSFTINNVFNYDIDHQNEYQNNNHQDVQVEED